VVANTTHVLAIEAATAAQAVEFLAPLKTSPRLQRVHAAIREVSPRVTRDRILADDFAKLARIIVDGKLALGIAD
jgi:histidine ammonia-lyase